MKVIYKFETVFEGKFTILMQKNAEILCVQQDKKTNIPCIWVLVESDNTLEERVFELFGTGNEIKFDMGVERKYIGTYQYQNGAFVGHLFERIN